MTKLTINIFRTAICSCFFPKNHAYQQNRTFIHWTRLNKRKPDFNNWFYHKSRWMSLGNTIPLFPSFCGKFFFHNAI